MPAPATPTCILPPTSALERSHYDVFFERNMIRSFARYSPPVFAVDRPGEPEILARLALVISGFGADADPQLVQAEMMRALVAAEVDRTDGPLAGRDGEEILAQLDQWEWAEQVIDLRLRTGRFGDRFGADPAGLTLEKLRDEHPSGIDFGPLVERFPSAIKTPSARIELFPEPIAADLERLRATPPGEPGGLVLVGRRHLRSCNTWMHNVDVLVKGKERCTLQVHPDDANGLGLADGGRAVVTSRVGRGHRAGRDHRRGDGRCRLAALRLGLRHARHRDASGAGPARGEQQHLDRRVRHRRAQRQRRTQRYSGDGLPGLSATPGAVRAGRRHRRQRIRRTRVPSAAMTAAISADEAAALDESDPLSAVRDEFAFPLGPDGSPVAYFAGNSLGLMPRRARSAIDQVVGQWSELAVAGHFTGDDAWYGFEERFEARQAPLVGARPGEVALMGSLTENLHVLMASFHRPTGGRSKILIEPHAFPSDRYAVAAQVELAGGDPVTDVITIPTVDPDHVALDDVSTVLDARGDEIATALIGGVNYYTGQLLDLGPICALLRARDITIGLDLAHAVGNVPLSLHDWDVDFARGAPTST